MKQQYILTIEAKKLPADMSKDISHEFNGECFLDTPDIRIQVEKLNAKAGGYTNNDKFKR